MAEERSPAVGKTVHREQGFDPLGSAGLFVGVSEFEDPRYASIPFAVDDAVDLAHLFAIELGLLPARRCRLALAGEVKKEVTLTRLQELRRRGAKVVAPGFTSLYRQISEQARKAQPNGLFLLTLATHGHSVDGTDFLVASDTLAELVVDTAVKASVVFDRVAAAGAPRRLVLLDACRERLTHGERRRQGSPMAESFVEAIAQATGQAVLSATNLGGFAYDDAERGNGVFTASVLQGLRGAAPADDRGLITVRSLADYLQEEVAVWVGQHRPDHADLSRGIARHIEGPVEMLPLAVNPEVSGARERYAQRREAVIVKLRENLGSILTGATYDQILAQLPDQPPAEGSEEAAAVEELLEEIEALDGGARSQRALRGYWREVAESASRSKAAPPSDPPASAPAKSPPPQVDSAPASGSKAKPTAPPEVAQDRPSLKAPRRGSAGSSDDPGRRGDSRRRTFGGLNVLWVSSACLGLFLIVFMLGWLDGPLFFLFGGGDGKKSDASGVSAGLTEASLPMANRDAGDYWDGPLGMRFRYIPAGTYTLGSPEDEPGRDDDETLHDVQLRRGFWLGETEVTQGQWQALMGNNPSLFKACGDDCPVEMVSWYDAVTFANRLSQRRGVHSCYELVACTGSPGEQGYACSEVLFTGLDCFGYRLPTEAEWEVAARAGTATAIWTGGLTLRGARDGPELDPVAWYGGNSGVEYGGGLDCSGWDEKQFSSERCGPHPACTKQRNPWEFCDMLGNVFEWVWDRNGAYPEGLTFDPLGSDEGADRVSRGGSWLSSAQHVRAACRLWFHPGNRRDSLGFRLALGQGRGAPAAEPQGSPPAAREAQARDEP